MRTRTYAHTEGDAAEWASPRTSSQEQPLPLPASKFPGARAHLCRSEQPVSPAPVQSTLPCLCRIALSVNCIGGSKPSSLASHCCPPLTLTSDSLVPIPLPGRSPVFNALLKVSSWSRSTRCLLDVPCQGTSLPHALLESSPVKLHVYHPPSQTTFYRSPFRYKHGLPRRK